MDERSMAFLAKRYVTDQLLLWDLVADLNEGCDVYDDWENWIDDVEPDSFLKQVYEHIALVRRNRGEVNEQARADAAAEYYIAARLRARHGGGY